MEDKLPDKFMRKASREHQKRLKPGECLRYIRMVLDSSILSAPYGAALVAALNEQQLSYVVRQLAASSCILWERNAGQRLLDAGVGLSEEWTSEKHVIRLLANEELQQEVKNNSLASVCEHLQQKFPGKSITLMVVGQNALRQKYMTARKLCEMQVEHGVCWQHQTVAEVAVQLKRFNKAIAEEPYKLQRAETLGGFKKYLANDKKQCVRVVDGQGMKRLWQQHLNRLPGVTIHVADTIMSAYSCPKKLMAAYDGTSDEGPQLLADLKVMRGAQGAAENARRLGDALSGKFHKFYTSLDPDEII